MLSSAGGRLKEIAVASLIQLDPDPALFHVRACKSNLMRTVSHGLPSDVAALAGWLLRSDWSSLLDGDQPEDPLVESLAELPPGESTCDDANTDGDKACGVKALAESRKW
eukprot:s4212_g1.t1